MQKQEVQANAMVCNLNQNPLRRPIASVWLPALLKSGVMWLLLRRDGTAPVVDRERYLLETESRSPLTYHLNVFSGFL